MNSKVEELGMSVGDLLDGISEKIEKERDICDEAISYVMNRVEDPEKRCTTINELIQMRNIKIDELFNIYVVLLRKGTGFEDLVAVTCLKGMDLEKGLFYRTSVNKLYRANGRKLTEVTYQAKVYPENREDAKDIADGRISVTPNQVKKELRL